MKITKEQWIDKLGCKTFKLEKCMKKKEREQENLNFQRDQKSFSKTLEGDQNREGKISENENFGVAFGRKRAPNMPWMEEVKRLLGEKVTVINEFNIDTEKLKSIKERTGKPDESIEYKTFIQTGE